MKPQGRKLGVTAILITLGIWALAISPVLAQSGSRHVNVNVDCPAIRSGTQFNITLTLTNWDGSAVGFNRVAVFYANPDVSIKGPFEASTVAHSVPGATMGTYGPITPGSLSITVPFTITTTQTSGTIIPLVVSLWQDSYSDNGSRGAGAGGAKVQ
jgi:hypothetical protein